MMPQRTTSSFGARRPTTLLPLPRGGASSARAAELSASAAAPAVVTVLRKSRRVDGGWGMTGRGFEILFCRVIGRGLFLFRRRRDDELGFENWHGPRRRRGGLTAF